MTVLEIRERVDVRLLANLSHNFRSPYEAILELVDNALGSRLEGRAVLVTLSGTLRRGGGLLVTSKGGAGMGVAELSEFLHWGKSPSAEGLNRYGQGGKAAIGYLGQGVRITTNLHNETTAYRIDDPDWNGRPEGLKRFVPEVLDAPLPGVGRVQTEIVGLHRAVSRLRLERELAWRYRPALEAGHLEIRLSKHLVAPVELVADEQHEFRHDLDVPSIGDPANSRRVRLTGWVGIAKQGFDGRGGIRCASHGRVVEAHEYFGHRTASFKASLNSLIGEVDLSFVPVVLDKNGFDTGSDAWREVEALIFAELAPYVEQLLKRRETSEPTDAERERAMAAKDVAALALAQLALEQPGATRSLAQGRKRRNKPDEEVTPEPEAQTEREKSEPRTPPPDQPVGKLRRASNALDWDVRALDPKIRSDTNTDGDKVEIVINNRYPLYRERRGDTSYMLETGLLEQLKPSAGEETTVHQYHEQVSDAIRLSLAELARTRTK